MKDELNQAHDLLMSSTGAQHDLSSKADKLQREVRDKEHEADEWKSKYTLSSVQNSMKVKELDDSISASHELVRTIERLETELRDALAGVENAENKHRKQTEDWVSSAIKHTDAITRLKKELADLERTRDEQVSRLNGEIAIRHQQQQLLKQHIAAKAEEDLSMNETMKEMSEKINALEHECGALSTSKQQGTFL